MTNDKVLNSYLSDVTRKEFKKLANKYLEESSVEITPTVKKNINTLYTIFSKSHQTKTVKEVIDTLLKNHSSKACFDDVKSS